MTEQHYLHVLNCLEPLSLPALHRLFGVAGSAERAWHADDALLRRARVKNRPDVLAARDALDVDRELADFELLRAKYGVALLARDELPVQLREIEHPPLLLYARGNVELLSGERLLAVVGSRKATSYGRRVIGDVVPQLVRAGVTIVSGLALGIDALAHKATLEAHGNTIAVLGSSLLPDEITPPSNQALARRLLENGGLIVSEYPPGTPGYASHFPERNRIIAGLCQGTLVVEAALKSGSLITARLASECSRDVFSVPGHITAPQSAGCNQLIERGAIPFTSCTTITDALRWCEPSEQKTATQSFSAQEMAVLDLCRDEPRALDDMIAGAKITAQEALVLITQLTLKRALTQTDGNRYQATL